MRKAICLFCLYVIALIACREREKTTVTADAININNSIRPPIATLDLPRAIFMVDASLGDTLLYKSGSILVFPPNAFVDAKGNVIKGTVEVQYREFTDPVDFFLAGIPMEVDGTNSGKAFVSSGMCELTAYSNNAPVFVNQAAKPTIHVATQSNANGENKIYFYDSVAGKWIDKGRSEITRMESAIRTSSEIQSPKLQLPIEPLRPKRSSGKLPVFEIQIDSSSMQELASYHNLKFEVDAGEKFDPKDGDREWSDVKITRAPQSGLYVIEFTSGDEKVTYRARPVFEGRDLEEAMKQYELKKRLYDAQMAKRLADNAARRKQWTKDSIENEKIMTRNVEIVETNKRTIELNRITEAMNRRIAAENKRILEVREQQRRDRIVLDSIIAGQSKAAIEARKKLTEKINTEIAYWTFQPDRFGYWNCDRIEIMQGLLIDIRITSEDGKVLKPSLIKAIYKSINSIIIIPVDSMQLNAAKELALVAVVDDKLMVLSVEEYQRQRADNQSKMQDFQLRAVPTNDYNKPEFKKNLSALLQL